MKNIHLAICLLWLATSLAIHPMLQLPFRASSLLLLFPPLLISLFRMRHHPSANNKADREVQEKTRSLSNLSLTSLVASSIVALSVCMGKGLMTKTKEQATGRLLVFGSILTCIGLNFIDLKGAKGHSSLVQSEVKYNLLVIIFCIFSFGILRWLH